MAGTIETQYKELLNPIKDPEQSFAINIAELLQSYVKGFADGKIPPNFNSAALLLQGSCSIYGKRVEYLHNLATKLYQLLIKKKNDGTKKDKDGKEKVVKENKFSDPFFSTEIRLGKNLSCLRKKASSKNAKKGAKKASDKKFTFVPVDLLPLEGEEKGDVFYDTRGEPVGNKGDYTLNKCRVTKSGWLLLPTVSPELVETDQLLPDYTIEEGQMDDDDTCHDSDMPVSTPADEGYPPSTGCSNTPGSEDPCSQNPGCEDPLSQGTDEGLGSLPCTPQENESQAETATDTPMEVPSGQLSGENTPSNDSTPDTPMEGMEDNAIGDSNHDLDGIENIPIDDADVAPKPRRSMRQALKVCQVKESESPTEQEKKVLQEEAREEVVAIKRAIQKKNTYKIPSKLKEKDKITNIFPASEFCARTFFSLDQKFKKNCILSLGVPAFEKNSALFKRFVRIAEVLKATNREKKKRKKNNEDDDVGEIDVEEMENILEPDNDIEAPHLDLGDIVIENSASPKMIVDNENPMADEEEPINIGPTPIDIDMDDNIPYYDKPGDSFDDDDDDDIDDDDSYFKQAAILQVNVYKEDLLQYVQTSDIMEKYYEWEDIMMPFLEELNKRRSFDINLYGSHILNAFDDTNRKQTITFRNFCKNKEKYEIHRYFMALLPLVNVGNVSIEFDKRKDGSEDILVTLLSRKMHHIELEEFGHTSGEHS